MTMAMTLPALGAPPHVTGVLGKNSAAVVLSREGVLGCKLRPTVAWRQDWGGGELSSGVNEALFRRSRSTGVVSCSMVSAKENAPDSVLRDGASRFNVLITGSTKGKAAYLRINIFTCILESYNLWSNEFMQFTPLP